MKKLMLPALSLLLGQGALIAVGPSNCGANRSSNLIVGSNFVGTVGYTPFEIIDTGVLPNNVIGFDAAVACELANRLGFAGVTFQQQDFDALLNDLTLGIFDIVMSAMSIIPFRKTFFRNVSFVKYNEDSLGLVYIKSSDVARFTNPNTALEELAGEGTNVAGIFGSREREIVILNDNKGGTYEGLGFVSFTTLQQALDALINGQEDIQALFVDGATAVALAASNFNLVAVNDVVDTAQTIDQTTQGLGIAIPNECCQLYVNIQKAIDDMNADGTLERLRTEFNVPQGFIPVSGLAPADCTLSPTINSNAIANYLFTNYCPCIVTPIIPVDGAPVA